MIRKFYRVLAVVLAALTLLGAWLLYKGDFWSLGTEEQKVRAILEYASAARCRLALPYPYLVYQIFRKKKRTKIQTGGTKTGQPLPSPGPQSSMTAPSGE